MNKNFIIMFIILTLGLILLILSYYIVNNKNQKPQIKNIKISNKEYRVEVVKSFADQAKGLSQRDNMGEIDGMLFEYPDNQIRSFWMKGMRFDLDIVWINDNKIIGITKDVSHVDQNKSYKSPEECNMVLELPAGEAEKNNLQIGDEINFK